MKRQKIAGIYADSAAFDGKVITVYESACNKYAFGKFFFADDVNALDINKVK